MAHDKELKNRFKKAMEDRRPPTNQSEVARYIGGTPQAIQQWASGRTDPKQPHLKRAAEYLGVSYEWLAFGRGELIREARTSRAEGSGTASDTCQALLNAEQHENLRLERENAGLKRILAARDMEIEAMKELIGKQW